MRPCIVNSTKQETINREGIISSSKPANSERFDKIFKVVPAKSLSWNSLPLAYTLSYLNAYTVSASVGLERLKVGKTLDSVVKRIRVYCINLDSVSVLTAFL